MKDNSSQIKYAVIGKSQETGSFLLANQCHHISGDFVVVDIHFEDDYMSESLV